MAHDVFVSYSNKDKPIADAVIAGLENNGIRCWIAPRDITPGKSWGEAINTAIEGSDIMVIILSENSNRSNQVVREVERAVANNVIIIPFRIENIDPTGAMAYFLSTEHWLDAITPPIEKHIQKLANTIKVFQSGEDSAVLEREKIVAPKPKPSFPIKYLFAIIGIAAMIVLGFFVVPKLVNRGSPEDDEPSSAEVDEPGKSITVTATPQPSFEVVGTWLSSGSVNNIFVQNNTAYIASGEQGIIILDVNDPSNPKEVGSYELGNAQNVIVQGQIAYVTDQGGVLEASVENDRVVIIDVKIPSSPHLMGEYIPESGFVHRSLDQLAIEDQTLYLTFNDTLVAIDISNPSQPVLLGEFSFSSNVAYPGVLVRDGIVYLLANILHIVDFRDPEAPVEIGTFDAGWGANAVLSNQMLYMANWDSGLTILDVSDPTKPIKVGSFMELVGNYELIPQGASSRLTFFDIAVSGDMAYLTFNFGLDQGTYTQIVESGVIAIDISDPTAPKLIDKYTKLDRISSVWAEGDVVYITDEPRGLIVLSLGRSAGAIDSVSELSSDLSTPTRTLDDDARKTDDQTPPANTPTPTESSDVLLTATPDVSGTVTTPTPGIYSGEISENQVWINTYPSNVKIFIVPALDDIHDLEIEEITIPENLVGTSPLTTDLSPGDYYVVAKFSVERFTADGFKLPNAADPNFNDAFPFDGNSITQISYDDNDNVESIVKLYRLRKEAGKSKTLIGIALPLPEEEQLTSSPVIYPSLATVNSLPVSYGYVESSMKDSIIRSLEESDLVSIVKDDMIEEMMEVLLRVGKVKLQADKITIYIQMKNFGESGWTVSLYSK